MVECGETVISNMVIMCLRFSSVLRNKKHTLNLNGFNLMPDDILTVTTWVHFQNPV